jgi:ribosomal-protein-serine acetyltransferase
MTNMNITIDTTLRLELINTSHAQAIFDMVDGNRDHLRTWLSFVDRMQTSEFARNFVAGTMQRNKDGQEYAFVILENEVVVGRIGVYKIDGQNKIGELGYWVVEHAQGRGIITRSCKTLLDFCLDKLQLNRIEIKCGTGNAKSQAIPRRLHFTEEGILRQAEYINGQFIDLKLYSFLDSDR